MIEKNRNILSNAIKKMPSRKPKASGWSAVAGGLDQVEAVGSSSVIASKLPQHKAPADAWSKIAVGLPPTPTLFINTFPGKLFLGSVIVGILIVAYVLFLLPEEKNKTIQNQETTLPDPIVETTAPSQALNSEDQVATSPSPTIESQTDKQPIAFAETEKSYPASPKQAISPPVSVISTLPDPIVETEAPKLLKPIKITFLKQDNLQRTLEEVRADGPINKGDIEYAKDMTKAEFKAGVFYAFKRYLDVEEEGMDIPQNQSSIGLDFSYRQGKWFIKTGIAYVAWKEKGDYTFNYDQNQLIYQYNYVDSTYINPNNGGVTFFTTETFVYDSVEGQEQDQASYEYKMLQIPILVGYSLFERKNFKIGILGGIGFDIRLSGKQFIPVFDQDGSTVSEVNNSLKYRTTNNWRVIGGLELGYMFAQKWELFAEPTYQWYMRPLYSPDHTAGVGLFNIKVGMRYIF